MGTDRLMRWFDRIYWTAVLAALFCAASVITGLLGAPVNVWGPLGLAGIIFAVIDSRVSK